MAIRVNVNFHPLRLVLGRRGPVQMDVNLHNLSKKSKKLVIKVIISNELSFSKGGFKARVTENIDKIAPDERKVLYYDIYSKPKANKGDHPIEVIVEEVHLEHNSILDQTKHTEYLRVE